MEFTVFYSWQNDTSADENRYFIRDCIKSALKYLAKEEVVEEAPRLDHDTKNVSGMPDIVSTIFKKN